MILHVTLCNLATVDKVTSVTKDDTRSTAVAEKQPIVRQA